MNSDPGTDFQNSLARSRLKDSFKVLGRVRTAR